MTTRGGKRKKENPLKDAITALKAIQHALYEDKGDYFAVRAYLDANNRYHDNLEGNAVLLEVAHVAILKAERSLTQ